LALFISLYIGVVNINVIICSSIP